MAANIQNPGGRGMSAIPTGIALTLLVIGGILIAVRQHGAATAAAMRSWPSTMGTITGAGLVNVRDPNDTTGWQHRSETGFRWSVDGREYHITLSEYSGRGPARDEHATRYHAGDPVRVFYDPADPSQGSLTTGLPPSPALLVIPAGLFAVSLPFWYLAALWFAKPRPSPSS